MLFPFLLAVKDGGNSMSWRASEQKESKQVKK
jgi:hypothetical protein